MVAERVGFEPTIRGYRIHTFQACAFDHSATAPHACMAGSSASSGGEVPAQDEVQRNRASRQKMCYQESHQAALRGPAFPANAATRAPFRPQKRVKRGFCLFGCGVTITPPAPSTLPPGLCPGRIRVEGWRVRVARLQNKFLGLRCRRGYPSAFLSSLMRSEDRVAAGALAARRAEFA